MNRQVLFATVVAAVGALHAKQVPGPPATPGVSARVFVNVTDSAGRVVPDLEPSDLVVELDGVPGVVTEVARATEEPAVVVLVDESISGDRVNPVRAALAAVVSRLASAQPGARLGLAVGPGEGDLTPRVVSMQERAEIQAGIERFSAPSFSTPLLERLIVAARGVGRESSPRRFVLLITHDPIRGATAPQQVGEAFRAAGASLWVLHLWPVPSSAVTDEETVLRELPPRTGGRRVTFQGQNVAPIAASLVNQMLAQYVVTYAPPPSAAAGAVLRVGVRREGVVVSAPAWHRR